MTTTPGANPNLASTYGPTGSSYPGAPGSEAAAKPKTLAEQATEAFKKGRDREAFQLLYADALVNEEAAERLPDEFRWVPYLKKPVMAVRWGVGVSYNPPRGYTGHPSPIGYEPAPSNAAPMNPSGGGQDQPRRRRVFGQGRQQQNQGSGQPSYGSGGQPSQPAASTAPSQPAELLTYYTGELGEKIVEVLTERMEDGKYGDVLARALESYEAPAATNNNNTGSGSASPGSYPPPGYPGTSGGAPGGEQPAKAEKFEPGGVMPGVVMLGEGSERELIKEADDQQVDFLIILDVSVRPSHKAASNTTKFRVLSLEKAKTPAANPPAEGAKPREIFVSKSINSHRVETAREEDEEDPLETEIDGFAAAIDAEVTAGPLPDKLTPEVALKRANFLTTQEVESPLANLAEIRCYRVKELIDDAQLAELYGKILGPEKAKKLLSGKTEADKQAALNKWLHK